VNGDWERHLAAKLAATTSSFTGTAGNTNEAATKVWNAAGVARQQAADLLMGLFLQKVTALQQAFDALQPAKPFWQRWRSSTVALFDYQITPATTVRFQTREAIGSQLLLFLARGPQLGLQIDVALQESIAGQYVAIFRDNGAIAGAQLWRTTREARKHPTLLARLWLLLSATAVAEGEVFPNTVFWCYDETYQPFTALDVENLVSQLVTDSENS
jgi:hypothetical protein